jgi:hypothetical protein
MRSLVIVAVLACALPAQAADPDPRLATAKTAFVFPVDALKDDQPIAVCFAERLEKLTPYVAAAKADADVLLGVSGDIAGDWGKGFGALGAVRMIATAQDGKVLWKGGTGLTTSEIGTRKLAGDEVACALAAEIADKLRGAMRKARGKK